jgi:hypothetical protein
MNMRPVEAAYEIVHEQQNAMAGLPDVALATLRSWSASIDAKIEIASLFSREAPKDTHRAPGVRAARTASAAAARRDGIAIAMLTPPRDESVRQSPETSPLELASLGPMSLPSAPTPATLSAPSPELPSVQVGVSLETLVRSTRTRDFSEPIEP